MITFTKEDVQKIFEGTRIDKDQKAILEKRISKLLNLDFSDAYVYTVQGSKIKFGSATYKQWQFLTSFDNVKDNSTGSTSGLLNRVSKNDMSELISLAKSGRQVVIE